MQHEHDKARGILPALDKQVAQAKLLGYTIPAMPHAVTGLALITPELALELLEAPKRNRGISRLNLAKMVQDMTNDVFYFTHQGVAFDSNGYLIDGQHRLNAIIESGKPQWVLVTTNIDPDAMQAIDAGKARYMRDVLVAQGIGHSRDRQALTTLVARTIQTWQEGETISRLSTQVNSTQNLMSWHEIIENYVDLEENISKAGLLYASSAGSPGIVVSAGAAFRVLATIYHDEAMADAFIERAGTGVQLTAEDPEYRLRNSIAKLYKEESRPSNVIMLAYLITAYNKAVEGASTKRLMLPKDGTMPKIVGYTG